jgi:hypothetical protein
MAENSGIWLRACAGEELSPSEQLTANMSSSILPPSFFTDAAAANMYRYSGFMKMTLSYNDWEKPGVRNEDLLISQRYSEEIRSRITQLQTEELNPDADLTWCGIR